MKYLTIIFLVVLVVNNTALAQPKVVVFNGSNDTEKPKTIYKNLIKLSALEIFSGDISLYYERIVSENFSFEGGLGFTIDDYLEGFFNDSFDNFSSNEDRVSKIGVSTSIGFRYYPFLASEEVYFAPELKYRYYHSDYEFGTNENPVFFKETKTIINPRITVGYVYFFDDKIFVDMFAGLGIAFQNRQDITSVYDNVNDEYVYSLDNGGGPRPRLSLGVKFGFAF
ncbi:MAG: hypothetical protein ACPGU5_02725 [Lishizhenia sp.]